MKIGDLVRLKENIVHPEDVTKLGIILKTKEPTPLFPVREYLVAFLPHMICWSDEKYLEIVNKIHRSGLNI